MISQYQARNELEITRQADFANSYFSQQLEIAQRELDTRQALRDAYLVLNPGATDPTVNALNFNNYRSLDRRVTVQENIVEDLRLSLQEAAVLAVISPLGQEARFSV